MATLDDLHQALIQADAAGDTDSAQALADHIRSLTPAKADHGWSMPSASDLNNKVQNFRAGALEAATGFLTSLSDPGAGNDEMALSRHLGLPEGAPQNFEGPALAQHGIHQALGAVSKLHPIFNSLGIFNPEDVKEGSWVDTLFREMGRFLPALAGGEASVIPRIARVVGPSIGATVGKKAGGPVGEVIGSLAGASVAGIGEAAYTAGRNISELNAMTPGNRAQELLLRSLTSDKTPPENVGAALEHLAGNAEVAKPVILADAAGPATAKLARTVAALPGNGSTDFVNFLAERSADQHNRIVRDIQTKLADGSDLDATVQGLSAEQKENASPLYDEAYAANRSVASPRLDEILETPAGKAALVQARIMMGNDMKKMGSVDPDIMAQARESGTHIPARGIASGLNLETWDYVKKALDDMIEKSVEGSRDAGIKVGLKNKLLRELDRLDTTAQQNIGPRSLSEAFVQPSEMKQDFYHGSPDADSIVANGFKAAADDFNNEPGISFATTNTFPGANSGSGNVLTTKLDIRNPVKWGDIRVLNYARRMTGDQNIDAGDFARAAKEMGFDAVVNKGEVRVFDPSQVFIVHDTAQPRLGFYKQARAAFAGPAQSKAAIEAGQDFLRITDPAALRRIMAKLPDSQKPFFQLGAARKLQDLVHGMGDPRNAVDKVFGNFTLRKQIEAVFGPEATQGFAESMKTEGGIDKLDRFVLRAANTQKDIPDNAGVVERGLRGYASGGKTGAVSKLLDLPARIDAFFNVMTPETRDELARLLMAKEAPTGLINRPPLPVDNGGIRGSMTRGAIRGGLLSTLASGDFSRPPTP